MKPKDENKLEAIFEATLSLTSSIGIAGLKMSDIAQRANVASGTLYIYFNSKEELLNALYKKLKEEGTLSIMDGLDHLPVKIQLYKIWESVLNYMVTNHAKTIFMEQFMVSPFISIENRKLSQKFTLYLENLLERGKREMIIKPIENELLISLMTGFIRNFTFHLVAKKAKPDEKMVRDSFSICWDAISS